MRNILHMLAAAVLCLCLPLTAFAAAASPRAVFAAEEPDASGFFSVKMTVYDAAFNTFQFALNYDPAVVQPVDQRGAGAAAFSDFAEKGADAAGMSMIGTALDARSGLIRFSGYVTPGANGSCISDGNAIAPSTGLSLLTFRFRTLKSGAAGFRLATSVSGQAYDESLPSGAGLARAGYALPLTVSFDLPESMTSAGGGAATTVVGQAAALQPTASTVTKDDLLKSSILLQIGNHAAVMKGGVTALYAGEPSVKPYMKQGRTYVPIRLVAEQLGAVVTYEKATRSILIEKGADTIRMYIGKTDYTLNGMKRTMDAAPEFMASDTTGGVRTMVPIRFVGEALGMQVEWTNCDGMVLLSSAYEWDLNGAAEQAALEEASGLLLQYSGFVA